ncbi:MAG: hypothetical protein A3G18_04785 [Rhodospirillales bacterium RIFCSPLOWO2_12_FULL_58_28]|nr:MAG: hypothetical protein A3G18_04785 [Rhodospirillales bacterium RIFCSPLOWO2_12_FULL_58_28]
MTPDGQYFPSGWAGPDDGFLVMDRNGNAEIDNITEMFSEFFVDGANSALQALTTMDGNHDGVIDKGDEAFSSMSIWRDANSDSITDAGELTSLGEAKIAAISLDAQGVGLQREEGVVLSQGVFKYEDGGQGDFIEAALKVATPSYANLEYITVTGGNAYKAMVLGYDAAEAAVDNFSYYLPAEPTDVAVAVDDNASIYVSDGDLVDGSIIIAVADDAANAATETLSLGMI